MSIIKNSVTLIAGGASVIGEAVVRRFLQLGSQVVICDLPSSQGEVVASDFPGKCLFVPTDVKSETDVKEALDATEKTFGKLNFLINCAERKIACRSINWGFKTVHPMDAFDDTLLTNVSGAFNLIRHAVPLIAKNEANQDRQKGVIINKSSIISMGGESGQVAFAASKGAVNSMTLPLARELGPEGIRVVAIAAGFFAEPGVTLLPQKIQKYFEEEMLSPQRLGDPEEFAHLCEKVIQNPMINGTVLSVDGGIRLKPV